jgi:hypothetical protein
MEFRKGCGLTSFFFGAIRMPPVICTAKSDVQKRSPGFAGTSTPLRAANKLGSAALTVAILVVVLSLVLTLATLLRLVLSRLATLLGLSGLSALLTVLSRLTRRLTLSDLVPLLALLIHIVCHKSSS